MRPPSRIAARRDSTLSVSTLSGRSPSSPSMTAFLALGTIHRREGRLEAALEAYESALALDPDDARALRGAGFALRGLGQIERARPLLARAAQLKKPGAGRAYPDPPDAPGEGRGEAREVLPPDSGGSPP